MKRTKGQTSPELDRGLAILMRHVDTQDAPQASAPSEVAGNAEIASTAAPAPPPGGISADGALAIVKQWQRTGRWPFLSLPDDVMVSLSAELSRIRAALPEIITAPTAEATSAATTTTAGPCAA